MKAYRKVGDKIINIVTVVILMAVLLSLPSSILAMSRAPPTPGIGVWECSQFVYYDCEWNPEKMEMSCKKSNLSVEDELGVIRIDFIDENTTLIAIGDEEERYLRMLGREGFLGFHGWTFTTPSYDGAMVISLNVPSKTRKTPMIRLIGLGDENFGVLHGNCIIE